MQQEGQEHIRNAHPGTDCTPKHLVFIGTLQLRNFSFHNQKHSGSNHWEKVFVGAAFVQKYSHGHKQKEGLGIEWRHGASRLSLSPPPHLMWIRMTGKDLNNRLNIYFTIQVLGQQIPNCEPWPKELEKHMVTLSMQCIMEVMRTAIQKSLGATPLGQCDSFQKLVYSEILCQSQGKKTQR